ncbi:MAG: AsmA family protein, partial [Elusimicrobiaceae bacterium]|nr:AsmA family protein [Elusimicrobiaceae bacterium]
MAKRKKYHVWKKRLCRKAKAWFFIGLRVALFASMLVLLLGAAAWLFFIRTFNAQHLSEVIAAELQKRLDRPVAVASMDLKFINAIELQGFRVLDTKGMPGQALLSADSVTVRFKLLPLLEHQLIIDEVSFQSPRFSIVRREDGSYNIPPIKLGQTSEYTSTRTGRKFTVRVEDWTLKDGVLSYKDLGLGVTHAVYDLNMHFERLRFNELSRFTMNMVLRNEWADGMSDMEIKGVGHVNFADFDWSRFALRSLRAQVYLFQKPVDLTLDLDNLRTPFFNVRGTIPAFESKDLSVFKLEKIPFSFPKASLSAKGNISRSYQLINVNQFTVSAADVKAEGKGKLNFSQKPYAADFEVSTNSFNLSGKDKWYTPLSRYKLTGKAALQMHLMRAGGKYTCPKFQVTAQQASGDIYGFLLQQANGEFIAKADFSDLYGAVSNGKLTVANTVFAKLDLSARWRKGNLYGHIASCEVNGVPLKMSVSVNNLKSARRQVRTAMHWKHFAPIDFIHTVQDFITVIVPLVPGGGGFPPQATGDLAWLRNFRNRLPNFMSNFSGNISADTFASPVLSGEKFNAEFELTGLRAGMKRLTG